LTPKYDQNKLHLLVAIFIALGLFIISCGEKESTEQSILRETEQPAAATAKSSSIKSEFRPANAKLSSRPLKVVAFKG